MKLALLLAAGLLVLPRIAEAQIELGFDSGLRIDRTLGTNVTTFAIPSNWLRVGFFPGQAIAFESLVTVEILNAFDETATVIKFLPGIVYNWRANTYFRGEAGMLIVDDPGGIRGAIISGSQFAFGVAVGTKRQIGPGPLYFRVEAAVDQWRKNSNFFARSEFRFLVGISVVVN